jgi:hypothetical protein
MQDATPSLSCVYVISMDDRADRFAMHMRSCGWRERVVRVRAIANRTDPELGCFLSHVSAWCAASEEWRRSGKDEWVIVAEDDARLCRSLRGVSASDAAQRLIEAARRKNADWMQLFVPAGCRPGVRSAGHRCPAFSALCSLARSSCLDALARCALRDFLMCGRRLPVALDAWILWCFCRGRPRVSFCSSPCNVFAPGHDSDIGGRRRPWWRKGGSFYEDYCAALFVPGEDSIVALPVFHRFMISFSTKSAIPFSQIS